MGLLDQRFAMEWVQKYIHLLKGIQEESQLPGSLLAVHRSFTISRPEVVRVGPSLPASSYPERWLESNFNTSHLERVYKDFLKALGVDSLQAARRMPSMAIRNASFLLTFILRWGELGFGMYLPCTQNGN